MENLEKGSRADRTDANSIWWDSLRKVELVELLELAIAANEKQMADRGMPMKLTHKGHLAAMVKAHFDDKGIQLDLHQPERIEQSIIALIPLYAKLKGLTLIDGPNYDYSVGSSPHFIVEGIRIDMDRIFDCENSDLIRAAYELTGGAIFI